MNDYFVSINDSLCLEENSEVIISTEDVSDPIERAISKYSKHPSIRKIRSSVQENDKFLKFQAISLEQIHTKIERLNPTKATTFRDIHAKLLKSSSSICAKPMQFIFSNCVANGLFSDLLKLAEVASLHKGDERTSKRNYRPTSVLPSVSKVFERLFNKQITNYIELCLSSILCSFSKGYNTQHALVRVLEKWKSSLNNGENIGPILMDLSKAFDCIRHDLLLAKLDSYGFSRESLCLNYSFLDNRHQRANINGPFSTYKRFYLGVPHASVLGPYSLTST